MTTKELPADRSELAVMRFDARVRDRVRALLTQEIIDEHARAPLGEHSDGLKRVLNYLRRSSSLTPYVLVCTKPFREWRIARLSGKRGKTPIFIDAPAQDSESKAMHAIFLKRIEEITPE
jgi:hypothetical protein